MSRKKAARSKGGGSAPSAALPPPAATAPRSPAPAPELPRNGGAAPGRPSLSSSGEFYDLTFKVRGAVGKGLPGEGQAGPEQSVGCPGAWGGPRGCAVPCHYEPNRAVPCRAVRSRAIPFHAVLSAAALPAATGKVPRRWGGRRAPTVAPSPPHTPCFGHPLTAAIPYSTSAGLSPTTRPKAVCPVALKEAPWKALHQRAPAQLLQVVTDGFLLRLVTITFCSLFTKIKNWVINQDDSFFASHWICSACC